MTFKSENASYASQDGQSHENNGTANNPNVLNLRIKTNYFHTPTAKCTPSNTPAKVLLDEVIEDKGERQTVQTQWVDPYTMEIAGASDLALHSYVIEAKRHGKKVEIIKTTTIKITD
jgi:hypothetical protein